MRTRILSFTLFLTSATCWAAPAAPPTVVKNDVEMMKTLSELNRLFPSFFATAAIYDTPLFEVLDGVRDLSAQHPEIFQRVAGLQELLNISASVTKQTTTIQRSMDPRAIEQLRRELDLQVPESHDELKREFLRLTSEAPLSLRLNGIFSGLAGRLSGEDKAAVFRMQSPERVEFLAKKFGNALPAGFDPVRYGLRVNIPPAELFAGLRAAAGIEERVRQLGLLLILSHGQAGTPWDAVTGLKAASLDLLKEKARISEVIDSLNSPKEPLNSWFDQMLNTLFKRLAGQIIEKKTVVAGALELREFHPLVAAFRGFPAGDCSTMYSALYALSPHEHNFYVLDKDGGIKGVVSMSVNEADGKPNIYVHSINGPRISAADTEIILRALYDNRAAWGALTMTTPAPGNLTGLINYLAPRTVMIDKAEAGKQVDQAYRDLELRKVIGEIHKNVGYDRPELNAQARLFEPGKQSLELTSKLTKISQTFETPSQVDLGEAYLFALEQLSLERDETFARVAAAIGFLPRDLEKDLLQLRNNHGSVAAFKKYAEDLFRRRGVQNPEAAFSGRHYLTGWGRLATSDAFAPENLDITIQVIAALGPMEDEYQRDSTREMSPLHTLIQKNMAVLIRHPAFIKMFNSALDGIANGDEDSFAESLIALGVPLNIAAGKFRELLVKFVELAEAGKVDENGEGFRRLARVHFLAPNDDVMSLLPEVFTQGFGFERLKILNSSFMFGSFAPILYAALKEAKTREEVLAILRTVKREEGYPEHRYADILTGFRMKIESLGITMDEIGNVTPRIALYYQYYGLATKTESPAAYLALIDKHFELSGTSLSMACQLFKESFAHFLGLKPTAADWTRAFIVGFGDDDKAWVATEAIARLKSVDQILVLLASHKVDWMDGHKAHQAARTVLANETTVSKLKKLKPTPAQAARLAKYFEPSEDQHAKLLALSGTGNCDPDLKPAVKTRR